MSLLTSRAVKVLSRTMILWRRFRGSLKAELKELKNFADLFRAAYLSNQCSSRGWRRHHEGAGSWRGGDDGTWEPPPRPGATQNTDQAERLVSFSPPSPATISLKWGKSGSKAETWGNNSTSSLHSYPGFCLPNSTTALGFLPLNVKTKICLFNKISCGPLLSVFS